MKSLLKNTLLTLTPQLVKLTSCITVVFALVGTSINANAGFLDSIYDLNRTVNSIGSTAHNIKSSKQNIEDLGEDVGIVNNTATMNSTTVVSGAVLAGKLNNTHLYEGANKSSPIVTTLSANDVMIYMGTESNGYYLVQSDKGEGWVAKPLVKIQY